MNTPDRNSVTRGAFWATAAALTVALALLFHRLLLPGHVMFSNDAPLGLLAAQADIVWSNFLSYWTDLNWVGANPPSGAPGVTPVAYAILGPILYAKLGVPLCLFLLGLGAWFFARQNRFGAGVAVLTGLAAALNSNPISYACWGLPPKAVTMGTMLVAVALLQSKEDQVGWRKWVRIILAGFSVGLGVVEGADVGAILSLYVAAFAVWQAFAESGAIKKRLISSGLALAIVALAAGLIATHSLASLVGTQIKGISGMDQGAESKAQRWEFATFGSLPPSETGRILVPGLFGYRMDTPGGGAYWGGVGSDGKPEHRFSGSGEYAGVLVVLVGAFAVASSLRKDKSPYSERERRYVWFWCVAALGSLLLAYGRFAPFYRLVFELPYFSTIRFPMKFLHGMDVCLAILFAYGLEALRRLYLCPRTTGTRPVAILFQDRWNRISTWDRRWLVGSLSAVALAVLVAMAYMANFTGVEEYISKIPFQDEKATAWFSIREVWMAVGFLAISGAAISAIQLGWFQEKRARWAWWILGLVLTVDMVRANLPWVITYDYRPRYESSLVFDVLKDHPWEHRVSSYIVPQRYGILIATTEFSFLQKEWLENQFQIFKIQSLDIDQMARMPELDKQYLQAFQPPGLEMATQFAQHAAELDRVPPDQAKQIQERIPAVQKSLFAVTRLWELTNTRYLLGWAGGIDRFNDLFDPAQKRFKVRLPFGLGLHPGLPAPQANTPIAEAVQAYTAVPSPAGPLAVLEFSGALPRAKFYTQWETITDDRASLARLLSPDFDPSSSVVVNESIPVSANPAGRHSNTVDYVSYSPKRSLLKTKSDTAGLLLVNDRWHEHWRVTIDGSPAHLYRANFLMRGVALPAGEHSVEFSFVPPSGTIWVSVSAASVALLLAGLLVVRPSQAGISRESHGS